VKPYYEHGGVMIYHGEALAAMEGIGPGVVDAIVTDPPYCAGAVSEAQRTRASGQGLRSENLKRFGWFVGDNMGTAGLVWLLRAVAVEARRVVKPTGSLLAFCDWRMVATLQPAIESAGLRFQNLVVWDKLHMGLGTGFRARHELILHYTLGSPEYHDMGTANVVTSKRVTAADREHQTQKPIDLLQTLCNVVSPPGGVILDPFMGSGTTLVAAATIGRKAIGIEWDEAYCEVAARRLSEAQNRPHPDIPQASFFTDDEAA
jgi:DNA modification methylase